MSMCIFESSICVLLYQYIVYIIKRSRKKDIDEKIKIKQPVCHSYPIVIILP